jgi:hypothetical protein
VQRGETPPTAEGYRSPRERNRVKLVEAMEYAEFDGRQQHWRTRKQRLEEEGRSPQVRQTQLSEASMCMYYLNDQFTMTGLCWGKHREYSQKKRRRFGRAGLA